MAEKPQQGKPLYERFVPQTKERREARVALRDAREANDGRIDGLTVAELQGIAAALKVEVSGSGQDGQVLKGDLVAALEGVH